MARRVAASTLMRYVRRTTTPPPRFVYPIFSEKFSPALSNCSDAGGEPKPDLSKPPYNMISYLGDWRLTEKSMNNPGLDYEHWFVEMDKPGGEGASQEQIIQCFVQTLARVLPWNLANLKDTQKRIYKVEFGPEISGFGCQVDWTTKDKLEELPHVIKVGEDYYPDPEIYDYGGELFVDGKIVKRPERESPS